MEELLCEIIEYTIPLEDAQNIIWAIQEEGGEDAANEWKRNHLARFN
tara:strand:- start:2212 stop:2352 length:141 start_codon:yes stop_codon:yes gene_type:complete